MIPFLDILLVLILVLFTSISFNLQKFQVDLPNSNKLNTFYEDSEKFITIEILLEEKYNFYYKKENLQKISLEEIRKKINDIIKNQKKINILLAADRKIYYNKIIEVLNFINEFEIQSVSLVTKTENK
ncbi:ExbD/TolR family protein [bacterium endosymbiont of Pedicinus badii]|uniref:ExbD/TolR family protein n=1 Tax=bacterium endosymbiont of Pedicinus badii TaxID=1719126 RepID=UPI0009BB535C|nr:biopolymer transporter ExbD [bacterium endosymbiont of Pedicinus badii]OQM34323.1 hypothetical protein AOQ89_00290 [bacterium endosymbiont of Pedicinus badii]